MFGLYSIAVKQISKYLKICGDWREDMPNPNKNKVALITAARRSPISPEHGALKNLEIEELCNPVIDAVIRDAQISKSEIDYIVLGNALGAGGNPARLCTLSAGISDSCPAMTVDTQCCSGMDAIGIAATKIKSGQANVILADVPASNGVIHVIDKVLMPPADLPTCDYTVGIGLSGMAFNPSVLEISVGETVCWQWTDETMAHNVKEVDGDKSNVFVDGGITSGTSQTTVDFRHTFTEDNSTFYYVCEPHILAEMYGKVIVGDGGVVAEETNTETTDDKSDSNTPGFMSVTAVIALAGALLFARNRNE